MKCKEIATNSVYDLVKISQSKYYRQLARCHGHCMPILRPKTGSDIHSYIKKYWNCPPAMADFNTRLNEISSYLLSIVLQVCMVTAYQCSSGH